MSMTMEILREYGYPCCMTKSETRRSKGYSQKEKIKFLRSIATRDERNGEHLEDFEAVLKFASLGRARKRR